jgi:hypothetical protein
LRRGFVDGIFRRPRASTEPVAYNAALAAKSIFEDDKWAHDTASKHLDALAEK